MTIKVRQVGIAHDEGSKVLEQSMHVPDNGGTTQSGAIVYTDNLKQWDPFAIPFLNTSGSIQMAIDASFTGTPENVQEDASSWTASNIGLAGYSFNEATHAHTVSLTVVDYSEWEGGETITINGTGVASTVRTEGVDFNAETNNNTTAGNIATSLDSISGITAVAIAASVIITADASADITTYSTTAISSEMTLTVGSTDASGTVDNDEALWTRSSTIDMDNFSALTGWVYLTSFNDSKHAINLRFREAAVDKIGRASCRERV